VHGFVCSIYGHVMHHHHYAALYPRERTPGTHWTGGWVGPTAGLDAGARRKILCPCRGSNPDRPTILPELPRLQSVIFHKTNKESEVAGERGAFLDHIHEVRGQIPARRAAILTEDFRTFPQTPNKCWDKSLWVPSTSFPIRTWNTSFNLTLLPIKMRISR
jgi:hypothetical protein